jgi:hypothetical protein
MPDKWPRFDPSRGYWLCENCWNGKHYPTYSHIEAAREQRAAGRSPTACHCPCTDPGTARRLKPRPGDQLGIPMGTPLAIGTKS